MGVTLLSLAVSLTSLAYVTYSWFIFKRTASINAIEISVENAISYKLKYFVYNGEAGYPASNYSATDVDVVVNNYQTEFLEIDQNYSQYVISLSQPAYRLTYALELSLASTSLVRDYEISITDYTSEASAIHYNYTTNQPIEIKEAINVYSTIIDGNLSNLDVTSAASTFVSAPLPAGGDKFGGGTTNGHLDDFTFAISESVQKKILLFTIEFSNQPSSYYNFREYGQNIIYYDKSPFGNSNVYKTLSFSLDTMLVKRVI